MASDVQCQCLSMVLILARLPKQWKASNRDRLFVEMFHIRLQLVHPQVRTRKSHARTRKSHAFKYRMPEVSKDVFKFSFFPRSITEWNSLPADLVNCESLSDFKLSLGKHVK